MGDGTEAKSGSCCTMSYVGTLKSDGSKFDSAKTFNFTIGAGEVIKGWDIGVKGMKVRIERVNKSGNNYSLMAVFFCSLSRK